MFGLVWFGLVLLLYGMSNFVIFLMPCMKTLVVLFNPYLLDKNVLLFPKSNSPKVNVIARLKLELVYYDVKVHHITGVESKLWNDF